MQSRQEREQDDVEQFRALSEAVAVGLRVCCPGIIQSFNPDAITVTVQAAGKESIRKPDGTLESQELPLMVDVPVFFPRGGDFTLTFPIRAGDECIVVFADRCFDAWHQSGGIQEAAETRLHDLSNAFALVGVFSQSTKISTPQPSGGNVQLRHNDGDCWVELTPDKQINIETPSDSNWHIGGNLTIQVDGNTQITTGGDTRSQTGGSRTMNAGGNTSITSGGGLDLTAAGGGGASLSGNFALTGNVNVTGDVTASGNIMDGGANTNHHTH